MNQHYLIIDLSNTFMRARHQTHRQSSTWDKVGFALHLLFGSINKCWRDQKATHVVFCGEGRSWRKDFYEPYKKNRSVARAARTEEEQEEDQMFYDALNDFTEFVIGKSNCTYLQNPRLEADDLIAGWIQHHPSDNHTIISSDSDFFQLISNNVNQYNGITDELYTIHGIFDKKGNPVIDKKTKLAKTVPEPGWLLFEKCIRGDSSDNVFSAYPRAPIKGSKNRIGMREAYEDRNKQGFAWNNFMLQKWVDHNEKEHRVLDDYQRNRTLIDLTHQPDDIKELIRSTVTEQAVTKSVPQIGLHFMKFCGKYDLKKASDHATTYVEWLASSFKEI